MQNQHPAIVRAAALQDRFFAHAPQSAPVAEIESTPASQLEVETHNAHCEYLEIVNYFIDHPWLETDAASDEIARRLAKWQSLKTELETQ